MNRTPFGLMEATTTAGRMDALCRFIEFWLGPRKEDYGESADAVGKFPLPMPLRQIYKFAGRWPRQDGLNLIPFAVPAFSHQDHLWKLDSVKRADDGKLIFLNENQGVWDCRTVVGVEEPPVWCVRDQLDEKGESFTLEKLVSNSLSRFITTFVLQELVLGSRLLFSDNACRDGGLCTRFESEKGHAAAVWLDGPYVYGHDNHFRLWNKVLVYNWDDSFWFAANDEQGAAFLREQQGPPVAVQLMAGRQFDLTINGDGSSQVAYRNTFVYEAAAAPADTFQYTQLLADLSRDSPKTGHYERNPMVGIRRRYELETRMQHFQDFAYVKSLFQKALDSSVPPNELLRQRFESEYPF